jgi:hypothetical protein
MDQREKAWQWSLLVDAMVDTTEETAEVCPTEVSVDRFEEVY